MLKRQQDTQRLRRQATEIGFEVNVHVPLGLVERKQQQRRSGDVELAQVYQLAQEVVAKTYKHNDFLTEVIGQGQAKKNKDIAIVGEPGAGKTTLLGTIASFIKSKTPHLPIFVSLASLQGRTIEDYLLKVWLPEAMGLFNPETVFTPAIEDELIKQFRKGGVWLLLDGVDEIGVDSPVLALATIQKQLTNWVGQARVVLTCRLNVWDVSVNNMLTGFDTYKTQEFTQEQADQFIQKWFAYAEKPQQGEQLQAKLKEQGRERIRDLVRHPLRLALLCQTFYLDKQGKLPETKAALYQRFNYYFYEWKQSLYPVDLTTRNELHKALGKLALAGINSQSRFRLSQSLASQEMGERLFRLADTLGWLNLVDRDAENDEPVYAFLHPMFQEYFAALAVEDWDYFLPRTHDNQTSKPVRESYRIFEPEWKEVVLLWLGRRDVTKQQKEEFIEALVAFEDGCGNFYQKQAHFLAAAGTAEFREYSSSDKIIHWLIEDSLNYFNDKQKKMISLINFYFINDINRRVLLETDRKMVIPALVQLLHPNQGKNIRLIAALYLLEFDKDYTTAINALLQLIESDGDKFIRLFLVIVLLLYGMNAHHQVDILIKFLVQLIERDDNKLTRLLSALLLNQIDPDNKATVNLSLDLINTYENKFNSLLAALLLQRINPSNKSIVNDILSQLLPTPEDDLILVSALFQLSHIREQVYQIWKQFSRKSEQGIISLLTLLDQLTETKDYDELISVLILIFLEEIAPFVKKIDLDTKAVLAKAKAINLNSLFKDTLYELIGGEFETAISLGKINPNIKHDLNTVFYPIMDNLLLRIKKFGESSRQNETVINTGLWLIPNLAKYSFDAKNLIISGLVGLIKITENEKILGQTAETLIKIDPGNETAFNTLVLLIKTTKDERILLQASNSLAKIDLGHEIAFNTLGCLIETTKDDDILFESVDGLKQILQREQFPKVVSALKSYMTAQVDKSHFELYRTCNDILWRYAQSMTYPDFYRAWHGEPSPVIQALENQFTDIVFQLQPIDKIYPIVINAQALEGEIDTSAIAQELCNQIYLTAFTDELEIPEVSNAPQLKRLIPQLKKQLQKQNLALILDKCEPNQAQVTFCRKLTDVVHIAWITNQPLEAPLKGFLPEQANLLSAIQSWINEVG
jgi:energy-coupling factor transporter ATP-binding protein EcfA2